MPRRVVPILPDVRWDPNAPHARFLATDDGVAVLVLGAHSGDPDQRSVLIFWSGVSDAQFGGPNDEGMHRHPLYSAGLSTLMWAGEVIDDDAGPGLRRHFVLPTKEAVAEVRASSIGVRRIVRSTSTDEALLLVREHFSKDA